MTTSAAPGIIAPQFLGSYRYLIVGACIGPEVSVTDRTLAATEDRELVVLPAFTGAPEQLWRIDQLADGTYRVMPKAVPNSKEPLALSAVGSSMPTLARFNPASDRQRWNMRTP